MIAHALENDAAQPRTERRRIAPLLLLFPLLLLLSLTKVSFNARFEFLQSSRVEILFRISIIRFSSKQRINLFSITFDCDVVGNGLVKNCNAFVR